jgi:hypothetical protein
MTITVRVDLENTPNQSSSKQNCVEVGKKKDPADMGTSHLKVNTGINVNSLILLPNYVLSLVIQSIKPNSAKHSSKYVVQLCSLKTLSFQTQFPVYVVLML